MLFFLHLTKIVICTVWILSFRTYEMSDLLVCTVHNEEASAHTYTHR